MKVEIKNYKRFHGHDGCGYDYTLYLNGKRTAVVSDDGWGGELMVDITGDQKVFDAFVEKCKALPASTWESDFGGEIKTYTTSMSWEIWMDDLVNLADMKTGLGQKIRIRENGQFFTIGKGYKKANRERIVNAVKEKYPNAELINGKKVEAVL